MTITKTMLKGIALVQFTAIMNAFFSSPYKTRKERTTRNVKLKTDLDQLRSSIAFTMHELEREE